MAGNLTVDKERMLREHLAGRGITNKRILEAFSSVPREEFVPKEFRELAYADQPLPIGEGQTISQPYTVAFMTQLLDPHPSDKILEIGTGSGYQAAILSLLVDVVYTVERVASLAKSAQAALEKVGLSNIKVSVGDGSEGLPENAPYEGVMVTAASPQIPPPLLEQLKIGGKLVSPVGDGLSQNMVRIVKTKIGFEEDTYPGFRFVPLVGSHGFPSPGG